MNFIETSSKESINVSEAFITMTRGIINPNNINNVFYLNKNKVLKKYLSY